MASESQAARTVDPAADLAAFVSALEYSDLPDRAIRLAERCFVDTVAVGVAGASAAAGSIAAETAPAIYGDGESTLYGGGTAPVVGAAFVNGTASHALDYDDVSWGMDGHPSPTMVAPILNVAEAVDATGEDVLTAYVAGFETQCYVAAPNLRDETGPGLHSRGWHPTAVFGTFGATAAAASLLGLDATQTENALNIAASMPAGLKRNFGSLSKPMHAGQAGAAGVRAAYLARHGFDAAAGALLEGFFPVYAGVDDLDPAVLPALGEDWALLEQGVNVKMYPSCYATHTSVHATATLVEEHDIDPEAIRRIQVEANPMMLDLLTYDDPRTEAEAKFSIPYPVAAAAVFDHIGIGTFEPETIRTPAVQRVRERVEYEVNDALPAGSREVTVTIETADGTYSRTQEKPPATHDNPISDEDLRAKFMDCATRTIGEADAEAAYEALDALRDRDDVYSIMGHLGGAG